MTGTEQFYRISKQALIMIPYRKSSKSSLLYIIQCFKFSSEDTSFLSPNLSAYT